MRVCNKQLKLYYTNYSFDNLWKITVKLLLLKSLLLLCHSPFNYCLWRIIKPTVKRILCARHCFWLPAKQTKTQRRCEAAATGRLISNHFQTYFISRFGSRLNIEWFDFMPWLILSDNIREECNARRKRANYRDKICRMPFFSGWTIN